MKKIVLVFTALLSSFILFAQEDDGNATVAASKLNVRMKPSVKSPRVGVLTKGDRVKVTKEDGFWAEMEVPRSIKFYVSEVYLINGKLTNSVNLRVARDSKSASLGLLPAGTKLEVTEETGKYGWIQVKAPAGTKLYAFKEYLTFDSKSAAQETVTEEKKAAPAAPEKKVEAGSVEEFIEAPKAAEEKKAAAPALAPVAPVKKAEEKKVEEKKAAPTPVKAVEEKKAEAAPAPVAPVKKAEEKKVEEKKAEVKKAVVPAGKIESDLNLLGAKFEKDGIVVEGTLYKIPKSTSPATNFAVLKGSENQGFVCGLDEKEFTSSVGKKVKYNGKSYRVPGWKAPIVVVAE